MDKKTLEYVSQWARGRVATGMEPPWTYHQLVQLADIAAELAAGMSATRQMGQADNGAPHRPAQTPHNVVQPRQFHGRRWPPQMPG